MPSRQIVGRAKSADVVTSAASVHAARVAQAVNAVLSPYLAKGEKMPDIEGLTLLVGKWLAQTSSKMVMADEANIHELSDDDPVRRSRDEAHAALNDEVSTPGGRGQTPHQKGQTRV